MTFLVEVKEVLAKLATMCGNTISRVGQQIIHEELVSSKDYINIRGLDALARMLQFQGDCAAIVRAKDESSTTFKLAFNGAPNPASKAKIKQLNNYILEKNEQNIAQIVISHSKSYDLCKTNCFVWGQISKFLNHQRILGIEVEGLKGSYEDYHEPTFESLCSILGDLNILKDNENFIPYITSNNPDITKFLKSLYQIGRAQMDIDKFIHITLKNVAFDPTQSPIDLLKNEYGVHCELVFLNESFDHIGVSKLSCLLCYELQKIEYQLSYGKDKPPVLGGHGINYADKWNMPPLLVSKAEILEVFTTLLQKIVTSSDESAEGHFRNERVSSLYYESFSEDEYSSDYTVGDIGGLIDHW